MAQVYRIDKDTVWERLDRRLDETVVIFPHATLTIRGDRPSAKPLRVAIEDSVGFRIHPQANLVMDYVVFSGSSPSNVGIVADGSVTFYRVLCQNMHTCIELGDDNRVTVEQSVFADNLRAIDCNNGRSVVNAHSSLFVESPMHNCTAAMDSCYFVRNKDFELRGNCHRCSFVRNQGVLRSPFDCSHCTYLQNRLNFFSQTECEHCVFIRNVLGAHLTAHHSVFVQNQGGQEAVLLNCRGSCILVENQLSFDEADCADSVFIRNHRTLFRGSSKCHRCIFVQNQAVAEKCYNFHDSLFYKNQGTLIRSNPNQQGCREYLNQVTFLDNEGTALNITSWGDFQQMNLLGTQAWSNLVYRGTAIAKTGKNVYWGTTDETAIRTTIYDAFQGASHGVVELEPANHTFHHRTYPNGFDAEMQLGSHLQNTLYDAHFDLDEYLQKHAPAGSVGVDPASFGRTMNLKQYLQNASLGAEVDLAFELQNWTTVQVDLRFLVQNMPVLLSITGMLDTIEASGGATPIGLVKSAADAASKIFSTKQSMSNGKEHDFDMFPVQMMSFAFFLLVLLVFCCCKRRKCNRNRRAPQLWSRVESVWSNRAVYFEILQVGLLNDSELDAEISQHYARFYARHDSDDQHFFVKPLSSMLRQSRRNKQQWILKVRRARLEGPARGQKLITQYFQVQPASKARAV